MSEQKRYTAEDFRHAVFARQARMNAVPLVHPTEDELDEMLEQAADAEEELANVKASKERWMQYQETAAGERNACIDELRKKDEEIAHLKKQLEAHESKTKRNCDRFDDAHNAWIAWQTEHCANGGHDVFPKWLFDPVKEGDEK